jgi:hypothetical protein
MAPPAPQSFSAAVQQDATDAQINQAVFAFAFAAAGLIVLGAVAYLCFCAVGVWTRARHASDVEERIPPRPLVLPAKVDEASKAPRRLILSPLYNLPLQDLEDMDKDHWSAEGGRPWRASLHAMGMASSAVHFGFPSLLRQLLTTHQDLNQFKLESDNSALSDSQETLSLAPEFLTPKLDAIPATEAKSSYHSSVNFSDDVSVIMPDGAYNPTAANPILPAAPNETLSFPAGGTVVHVIHSRGSSPNIVVEDYTPSECSSASCAGSFTSDTSLDDDGDGDGHATIDRLKVPPMSWVAPRALVDAPCATRENEEGAAGAEKTVQKKGSVARLVAVLGEISNVARRRPPLPSEAATLKQKAKRGPAANAKRSKENVL